MSFLNNLFNADIDDDDKENFEKLAEMLELDLNDIMFNIFCQLVNDYMNKAGLSFDDFQRDTNLVKIISSYYNASVNMLDDMTRVLGEVAEEALGEIASSVKNPNYAVPESFPITVTIVLPSQSQSQSDPVTITIPVPTPALVPAPAPTPVLASDREDRISRWRTSKTVENTFSTQPKSSHLHRRAPSQYSRPTPCRYGSNCRKSDCAFLHPEVSTTNTTTPTKYVPPALRMKK